VADSPSYYRFRHVPAAAHNQLKQLASFIWNIADDMLRDLCVRDKYRDVILPMTVLRCLDAVLEPTKDGVLDMKTTLGKADIEN
jgi:type I restriction enzyme M protein